jgi:predicted transcriptional regulator of viral defense system
MAAPQDGYFTGDQALAAGFSPQLLQYYIQKALARRVCRGVYHLAQYPHADHEELMALWLWSKREGVFSHETALMLHGLGEAPPDRLTVTMPAAWRRRRLRLPLASTVYYADIPEEEVCRAGSLLLTAPLRTLVDCALAGLPPELVERAARHAIRRRLVTRARLHRAVRAAQQPVRVAPPPLRTRTYL